MLCLQARCALEAANETEHTKPTERFPWPGGHTTAPRTDPIKAGGGNGGVDYELRRGDRAKQRFGFVTMLTRDR